MATSEVDLLTVWLGEQRVGSMYRLPDDRITFTFDQSYAHDADRPTLSLGFKGAEGGLLTPGITKTKVPPYFSNLLPEGHLREYLAERVGVKAVRDFPLLAELGDDLPGNVRVRPEGKGPVDDDDMLVRRSDERQLKFSLAGVQLKFSALQEASGGLTIPARGIGGDWIVKLPSPQFAEVPAHERAMLELARMIGITVPETRLVKVAGIAGLPTDLALREPMALAVRRFDRQEGARIHTEDFAQVFRQYPEGKYGRASNENIAKVLLAEQGPEGVHEMVRRLVFTVLIGNGDMHLKNWSVVYPDGRSPALSPAYDYLATVIYMPQDQLGLSISGTRVMQEIGLDAFARFADKVGMPTRAVSDTVRQTVSAFKEAWRNYSETLGLPEGHAGKLEKHFTTLPLWKLDESVG